MFPGAEGSSGSPGINGMPGPRGVPGPAGSGQKGEQGNVNKMDSLDPDGRGDFNWSVCR